MKNKEQVLFYFCALLLVFSIAGCGYIGANSTKTTTIFAADGATKVKTVEEVTPESPLGKSDYAAHVDGKARHSEAEAARVTNQTKAIAETPCPTDPVANAWCSAGKTFTIGTLKPEPYGEGAPDTMLGTVKSVFPFGIMGWMNHDTASLGKTASSNSGSKFGDNATVTNSQNHTEANPTSIGTSNTSNPTSTSTPTSVPATDSYNITNPVSTTP